MFIERNPLASKNQRLDLIRVYISSTSRYRDAYNGISNSLDSNPSVFQSKNQSFFRIFRFEINLDQINVKNCKVCETNNFTKFCSGTLCALE